MPAIVVNTDSLKPGTAQMPVYVVGDDQNWSLQFNNGTNLYNPTGVRMDIGYIKGLGNQTFASAFQWIDRLNNRHTGSFVTTAGIPGTLTWDEDPIAVYGDNGTWLVKGRIPPASHIRKVYINYGGSGLSTVPAIRFQGGATQTGFGATATATIGAGGAITSMTLTDPGFRYSVTPEIVITGDGTTLAAYKAATSDGFVSGTITSVRNGSMYTTATVTFRDPEASATATIGGSSVVTGLVLAAAGNGYTSAPTVAITGGGGASAAATAALANATWGLSGLTLTGAGSGYTSAPTISFSGGTGSLATAIATIGPLATQLASITLTSPGLYTGSQGVQVAFTGGGATTQASGTVVMDAAGVRVIGVVVDYPGVGYTSPPTATFSVVGFATTPQDATGTAVLGTGAVVSVELTNPGSGYGATAPTVAFSSGAATATAQLIGSPVGSLTITNAGSGYTSVPAVGFSGGAGTGAAATATIALGITAITMRQGGYAYTSLPTVKTFPDSNADLEAAGVEAHSIPYLQNFAPSSAIGAITATPFTSGRRDTSGNLVYDDSLLIVRPRYLIQPTLTLQADALTWAGVFTPVNSFVNAVLNYRRSLVADVEIWGEGRLLYVGSLTILKA